MKYQDWQTFIYFGVIVHIVEAQQREIKRCLKMAITKEQINEASDFLELVISNNELLLERFSERYNEFSEEFEAEPKRVCSTSKVMHLAIYYTKIYNCYLIYKVRDIVSTHFWEATETQEEN